ncbi:phosphatidylinositol mannoside acyltransferase [Actinomyces lilanjuaniae]|uniref:phosphatidylinositol mannoside acyltransferase n=1 Tax=Actinomyces lilanjuaniae TaxID=2321394 RepID=UPI001FA9BF83|nr:phosphatidylinositol mannoside acyltransferase [Actinomyces lilanjuaniae]
MKRVRVRQVGAEDLYRLAWKAVPHLPGSIGYALFHVGADLAWALHRVRGGRGGVGQLERNLARLLDQPVGSRQVSRLSRQAMRSYMRYFYEAFALPSVGASQLAARVRFEGASQVLEDLGRGNVVVALPHTGNWDLAAAWACRELAPVLTVAERLEPEDLFEQFTRFREQLGLRIIGQGRGEKVFDRLLEAAGQDRYVIALLADRDLSSSGVRAELCGYPVYVAAGPAALAHRLSLPLYTAVIYYERLSGRRRRQAGSPWGLVLSVRKVEVPVVETGHDQVAEHTRAWVRAVEPLLVDHLVDWHMLQPVFEEDLDPERLARGRSRGAGHGEGASASQGSGEQDGGGSEGSGRAAVLGEGRS